MSRPSKQRKSTIQRLRKEIPKLKKELKEKKILSKQKMDAWANLPESEWSDARRAHTAKIEGNT